jgi:NAD(P)H-hydrate epimerase
VKAVRSLAKLPKRAADAHKGDFGKVVIVAGSKGMLGAAVLCARAAARSGAGLVRVGLPESLLSLLPLSVPEATTFVRTNKVLQEQVADADAIVIGPGLTTDAISRQLVKLVLKHSRVPVVVDADALNVLAPIHESVSAAPLVLTPHPGEAARLLGTTTQRVQADRMQAIRELCERSEVTVVLKGNGTLVADGERYYRNPTGNPGMAGGGSGDVLAGLLGALLARGLTPFEAASLGANIHGKAGDLACAARGENGMVASDIIDAIAEVMR